MMPRRSLPILLITLAACGPTDSDPGAPVALPLLTLAEPSLEIGVVEGDEAYTFASIESVLRLPDGSIAVSDGGNTRISLYDEAGTFLRSWASQGEGPGEFRTLSRLYPLGPDSLMAADNATARLTAFDLEGGLGRQLDGLELARDSTFRLDSWLYGRFWVDGALDASARDLVRAAIDRLPPPRTAPGYRTARVARDGGLWVREPDAGTAAPSTWTRLGPTGDPLAVVRMPAGFTPLDITADEVLGRWLGPADVHFVRVYPIAETGETRPVPAWLQGGAAAAATAAAEGPSDEESRELMGQSIRNMAMAQEMHYSRNFTYTTNRDSLEFEPPEGLGVSFTHAHARGWAAVFTHPTADRLCGLAFGFGAPPGWAAGAINCGPRSMPPDPPGA